MPLVSLESAYPGGCTTISRSQLRRAQRKDMVNRMWKEAHVSTTAPVTPPARPSMLADTPIKVHSGIMHDVLGLRLLRDQLQESVVAMQRKTDAALRDLDIKIQGLQKAFDELVMPRRCGSERAGDPVSFMHGRICQYLNDHVTSDNADDISSLFANMDGLGILDAPELLEYAVDYLASEFGIQ